MLLRPRAILLILNCATIKGKQSKHIVSAPTGAGKSLTFELAPYTFGRLFGEDCNAIVLVIVPLISLMKAQVSNLNSHGFRASYVGDDCSEEQLEDILNLKEKIVIWLSRGDPQHHPHPVKLPNKGFVLVSTVTTQSIR